MPHRTVNAYHAAVALINDRVDRDRCFSGFAIPDDQFALATPQRQHRIDHQQTGIKWSGDEITVDDGRRWTLDRLDARRFDRRASVHRNTECVHDTAQQLVTDRHAGD